MAWFIPLAQGFKIMAGLAQAAVALWFAARSPRTRVNMAFALAFGTNGLAFALALLALMFAADLREEIRGPCAVFSAALSINYADHIGASLIRSGAAPPATIQLGGMRWGFGADVAIEVAGVLFIAGAWLWNFRTSDKARAALAVVLCVVVSFGAGAFVRIAGGSYRSVQESGFFGLGLIAASALLVYGMPSRRLGGPRGADAS